MTAKDQGQCKFLQIVFCSCLIVVLLIVGEIMPSLDLNTRAWARAGDQDASATADLVSAEELGYAKAVKEAEQKTELHPKVYQVYGNFLCSHNRLSEAAAVYKQGVAYAEKVKLIDYQRAFLLDQGYCEYNLWLEGDIDRPDLSLAEKAWQLRQDASNFNSLMYLTMANIYSAHGQYQKADSLFDQAMSAVHPVGNEEGTVDVLVEMIRNHVRAANYAEANRVFIQAVSKYGNSARRIIDAYRKVLSAKELTVAGMFPKVQKLLAAGNFVELDQYADQLRAAQTSFPSGRWYIDVFNDQMKPGATQAEAKWQARMTVLEQWIKEKPESTNAKIALANFLTGYAWKARGSGWATQVTETGWSRFTERLKRADELLQQVKTRPPDWYGVAQRVALGQSWRKEEYDKMVNACLQKYPRYNLVVFQKVWFLQPRWHGEAGEADKFLDDQVKKLTAPEGDILYGRTLWWLDTTLTDALSNTQLSWPRARAGLQALIKKNPDAIYAPGELSILALQAGDTAAAESAYANSHIPK
jgi:tetratricopeptide (TPR) repeat protein